MNVFAEVEQLIRSALETLQAQGKLPADLSITQVELQEPRDPAHGDIASNIAMTLAKPARMKPRDIAEFIAEKLRGHDAFTQVEVAGPGFLNLTVAARIWQQLVSSILKQGKDYGRTSIGQGQRVNVEYVSANPTGPMHVGHCRGDVFGDTLCNLLELAGYEVTREYYVNDAGSQVEKLARSTYLRYREALGEEIGEIPPGLYPGEYLKPIGAKLAEKYGRALLDKPESEWLPIVRETAVTELLDQIKDDLATLGVHHDIFFS